MSEREVERVRAVERVTERDGEMLVSPSTGLDPEIQKFISRLMTGYDQSQRQLANFCERVMDRFDKSEAAALKAFEMRERMAEEREELISRRHKRDLEAAIAASTQENKAAITRDLRSLLMLAGKRLAGVPLTGNDSHGLQDLLSTFSMEQIDAAMTGQPIVLSTAQQQLLMNVLSSLAQGEKAQAAE